MATIPEALSIALQHHQAGRLQAAEQIYRQILTIDPQHVDALHLLGVIAQQAGQHDAAVEYIGAAIRLHGTEAAFHNNLGLAFYRLGRMDEAIASFERAVQLKADFAEAHYNLGIAWHTHGQHTEAIACYQRALQLRPGNAETHYNLGVAWDNRGIASEAIACYQRALQLQPNHAATHNNLGNAWKEQGRLDEATACYRRALHFNPDFAAAHNNLGSIWHARRNLAEAIACYKRALQLCPEHAEVHNNLGLAWHDQGRLGNAISCYERALQLRPDYPEVYNNLGNAWKEQGRLAQAIVAYQRALELKPGYAEAYNNLGNAWKACGKLAQAIDCYQRAVQIKPDFAEAHMNLGRAWSIGERQAESIASFRKALQLQPDYTAARGDLVHALQQICLWEDIGELSRHTIDAVQHEAARSPQDPLSPFSFVALPVPTTAEQQFRCARRWTDERFKSTGPGCDPLAPVARRPPGSRTTIGYLSVDFREHPVASLIAGLFENHNRNRFVIHGYSYGPDDHSPMRRRLVNAFDRFIDLKNSTFAEAAQIIAADGVDILVDLTGHTGSARTQILAMRPAPIQVNFLGYPGTMGAPFMDYILVDEFIVPLHQQPFFSEKLVHLPGCYQVNDSHREISPSTPTRSECGLPEHGFVFCSFNNSYKFTVEIFDVWMTLLQAVPGSVLWLLAGNSLVPGNLRREAEARGVSAQRLVFAARQPGPEHLARHRVADLFLDTFPYNAHTTASDALWAGCPVVTLAGDTFASRVAGSLLRTVGLPELITTSREEYAALALRLARDANALASLRACLQANRSSSRLFDAGRFARSIEQAYATMLKIRASGEAPRAFAVSAIDSGI